MSSVVSLASCRGRKDKRTVEETPRVATIHQTDYTSFDPKAYVAEYYQEIGVENRFLLDFYHRVFQRIPRASSLLEFGGGPTIYQLLSARNRISEIVFAEFLDKNRQEVRNWILRREDAIDWDKYLNAVLRMEHKRTTEANREKIREELEPKITQIIECDAFSPNIIGSYSRRKFDVVSSSFCLECISPKESDFQNFLGKLLGLLKPGGTLILTMLKGAKSYRVGDYSFPAFPLDEEYIRKSLRDLGLHWISTETIPAEAEQGYDGLFAVTGEKGK